MVPPLRTPFLLSTRQTDQLTTGDGLLRGRARALGTGCRKKKKGITAALESTPQGRYETSLVPDMFLGAHLGTPPKEAVTSRGG